MAPESPIVPADGADLLPIQRRNVAVLGYQGLSRAHALCLRDSGVDVRIGLPANETGRDLADADGLRVVPPYEACEESDLIALLGPVQQHPELFGSAVAPNLVPGDAVLVGSGFGLRYDVFRPPAEVDVVMVASIGSGDLVRTEFEQGRGVPALVGVDQDASGEGWPLALSYAGAVGAARAGAIRVTVAQEAESALFGEAVVAGAVAALLRSCFETLVGAGCPPELAFVQVRRALAGVAGEVLDGRPAAEPEVLRYGERLAAEAVLDAPAESGLAELLGRVQADSVAADVAEVRNGSWPAPVDSGGADAFAEAGRTVRSMMGWLRSAAASPRRD